ncbi:DarT ssDNA thymidine ADP-ribosyltransferase family protein [Spirillospora sp. CA-255316]
MSANGEVAHARAAVRLTRLAHFTPAKNLFHITRDEQIRSSKELADNASDQFSPTDPERYDDHPDRICCSMQFPNAYYLSMAKAKGPFLNYRDWVCLLLDAALVDKPGTLFSPCNAARDRGTHLRAGRQALLDCYATVSKPGGWRRGPRHLPGAATDLQAEALIPGPVPASAVTGIVVADADIAREQYAVLHRRGHAPERFCWIVAPIFFDRAELPSRIRNGGTIEERLWSPSADWEDG